MEKSVKHYIYCENTEGGMAEWDVYNPKDLDHLSGWMKLSNVVKDEALVRWMETAEVGDYRAHRLGIIFRVKDKGPSWALQPYKIV